MIIVDFDSHKEFEQWMRDLDNEVVATVLGRDVTRGELWAAFNAVANKTHWKNPIDAVVDLNDAEREMLRKAVIFFTGSVPSFKPRKGSNLPRCRYRVRATGYYAPSPRHVYLLKLRQPSDEQLPRPLSPQLELFGERDGERTNNTSTALDRSIRPIAKRQTLRGSERQTQSSKSRS
jgi:hypothetical protein